MMRLGDQMSRGNVDFIFAQNICETLTSKHRSLSDDGHHWLKHVKALFY
jgi:hypothetical protein